MVLIQFHLQRDQRAEQHLLLDQYLQSLVQVLRMARAWLAAP